MCDCGTSGAGKWGAKVGGQIGDAVSAYGSSQLKRFKGWSGLGDYTLHTNSLVNGGTGDVMSIRQDGRALIVRYREYIGDLTTHPTRVGDFNSRDFTINPGNVITFPWLSPLANQYDQYKPLGIIFEYVSTVSNQTAGGALGSVLASTEYDILDEPFADKREMLNSAYSTESKLSDNLVHGLECDPRELQRNVFYIRQVGVRDHLGSRDYTMARTTFATQGGTLPVDTVVGSLYVHYEFAFYKEQMMGGIAAHTELVQINRAEIVHDIGPIGHDVLWRNAFIGEQTIWGKRDLGITLIEIGLNPTVVIPPKWAGSTFRITWRLTTQENQTVPAAARPAFDLVNCNVTGKQNHAFGNRNNVFGATNSYESFSPAPDGVGSATTSMELIHSVTLDNVMSTNASITMTVGNGPFPVILQNDLIVGYLYVFSMTFELISDRRYLIDVDTT